MALTPHAVPKAIVTEVLRQEQRPYPLSKRRELAEAVVMRAIEDPRAGTPAILSIAQSGYIDRGFGGVPDPAAMDYLVRIARDARVSDERRFALLQLLDQVDPGRALPFLREVAMSSTDKSGAFAAVEEIVRLAFNPNVAGASSADRAAAERTAHELLDQDRIRSDVALSYLCEVANEKKWATHGRCRSTE